MFKLVEVEEGENPLHVELVTEWDYSYVLQCMANSGNTLIIGDIVRSVALLDIDWKEGKLERKARDHQDLGPYRLAASGDTGIIGANVSATLEKVHPSDRISHVMSGGGTNDSSVVPCSRSSITVRQPYKRTEYSVCINSCPNSSRVPCQKKVKAGRSNPPICSAQMRGL